MQAVRKTLLFACVLAAGCGDKERAGGGLVEITAWFHTGREAERATIEQQVERFHASQDSVRVHLVMLPEGSYNGQLQAAATAGDLPELFELDGPYVARLAWQRQLRALETLLPDSLVQSLLPSIRAQGTWKNQLYAVGTFDSGLALYARGDLLTAVNARVPQGPDDAWSLTEFEALLEDLAATDTDGAVLDLKLSLEGEWISYAFMPLLHSAGGAVLGAGAAGPSRAAGALDGAQSVRALSAVQRWIQAGRVDPNLDDAAFVQGRVALAWGGHWDFARYDDAWGEDLVLIPLPDLGVGSRTGQGSWCWAVHADIPHAKQAAAFLRYLLREREIVAMCEANGAVPARSAAAKRMPAFAEGGSRRLFFEQLAAGHAVPRPRTPAYPVVTSAFQRAFAQIRDGGSVEGALRRAAHDIDRELEEIRAP